jgi:hypothetical protein
MQKRKFLTDYNLTLFVLTVIFFFIYSYFSLSIWLPKMQETGQVIYTWPDAMANQGFINHFIQTGSFIIETPGNVLLNEVIHPRSVNAYHGNLVPMSFLGLPIIYGLLGKIIGINGTLFLTPFFACLAVMFFYSLIKRLVKKQAAFIAGVLLLTLGAFVYYSTQVMLPNVLFVSLLIIGLWVLTYKDNIKRKYNLEYLYIGLGAFIIGLALTVRTVEAPWVLAVCLAILLFFSRHKWYLKVPMFIFCLSIAFMPIIFENKALYGDYWNFGYLKLNQTGDLAERLPGEFQVASSNDLLTWLKVIFAPFGFHPRLIWLNFYRYFLATFYPYLIFGVAALIWFIFDKKKRLKEIFYLTTVAIMTLWLTIYYGSWQFQDNLVLLYNNIGSSYTRYWLPLYIVFLPAIGWLLVKLRKTGLPRFAVTLITVAAVVGLSTYSYWWAVKPEKDGLAANVAYLNDYYSRLQKVSSKIESDSVIVVDRMDKVFWPKYQVAVFLRDFKIFEDLKKIVDSRPIYYFSDMKDAEMELINQEKIKSLNLRFELIEKIDDEYRLFRLLAL